MDGNTLHLPEIGSVKVIRSDRARSVSISVKPFTGVEVVMPAYLPEERVKEALQEKMGWIRKHLAKMARVEQRYTEFREGFTYQTRGHKLVLEKHEKPTLRVLVANGIIRVYYPAFVSAEHPKVQDAVRKGVEEAWRIEGKSWLPKRTAELAAKFGFTYTRVTIRSSRTRWGSCSWDNNINLSLHLMMLPDHLIDYVILHELAHTVHKNHGKQFWALLDKVTGNVQKLEDEINAMRIGVY
jgi:predicted metal-dependent hydrolase